MAPQREAYEPEHKLQLKAQKMEEGLKSVTFVPDMRHLMCRLPSHAVVESLLLQFKGGADILFSTASVT